jgi:hypothetical protein
MRITNDHARGSDPNVEAGRTTKSSVFLLQGDACLVYTTLLLFS